MLVRVPLKLDFSLKLYMRCPACGKTAEVYTPKDSTWNLLEFNCGTCGWHSSARYGDPSVESPGFINVKVVSD